MPGTNKTQPTTTEAPQVAPGIAFDIGAFTTQLLARQDRQAEIALENGTKTADAIGRNTVVSATAADSAAKALEMIGKFNALWAAGLQKIETHEVRLNDHETRIARIEGTGTKITTIGGFIKWLAVAIAGIVGFAAVCVGIWQAMPAKTSENGVAIRNTVDRIDRKMDNDGGMKASPGPDVK